MLNLKAVAKAFLTLRAEEAVATLVFEVMDALAEEEVAIPLATTTLVSNNSALDLSVKFATNMVIQPWNVFIVSIPLFRLHRLSHRDAPLPILRIKLIWPSLHLEHRLHVQISLKLLLPCLQQSTTPFGIRTQVLQIT